MNNYDKKVCALISLKACHFVLGEIMEKASIPLEKSTIIECMNLIGDTLKRWHPESEK